MMGMDEGNYQMDRYNEIKVLLKKWETSFFEEHKKKPNKVDIGCASEETQKLYREYRAIKQAREKPSGKNDQSATLDITGRDSADSTKHHDKDPESDIWGSHLNRGSRIVEKLSSKEYNSITASAQYYGMKLKAKIGTSGKERPISLRKTMTPRKPHMSRERPDNIIGQVSGTSLVTSSPSESLEIATKDSNNEPDQLDIPYPMLKRATPSNSARARIPGSAGKLEQLRQNVVRRMSSINAGWLARCQGTVQPDVELIISGSSSQLAPGKKSNKFDNSDHNEHLPLSDSASVSNGIIMLSSDIVSANHGCFCPLNNSSTLDNDKLSWKGDISLETYRDEINCNEQFSSETNRSKTSSPKLPTSQTQYDSEKSFPSRKNEPNCQLNSVCMDSGTERKKHSCCEASSEDAGDEVKVDFNPVLKLNDCVDSIGVVNSKKQSLNTNISSRKRPREMQVGVGEGKEASLQLDGKAKKHRTSTRSSEASSTWKQKRKSTAASKSVNNKSDSSVSEELDKSNSEMLRENLYGEVEEEKLNSAARKSIRIALPKKDGNFVRINLKKKSHVRGNVLKGAQLRKQVWKQKLQMKGERFGGGRFNSGRRFNRSGDTCFHCGGTGHWAKDCRGRGFNARLKPAGDENVKSSAPEEEDIAPLPTLEEVARLTSMSCTTWGGMASVATDESSQQLEHIKDAEVLIIHPAYELPVPPPPMEPLYSLREDGNVIDTPPEVHEALLELGYKSFRSGQELAVMRILSGLSSLVVLSTGMGKSLCYQLPAYLYAKRSKCITLVVSPLVSLMDDQVSGLPSNLKAICIHSNMSKSQREVAIAKVKAGAVHVLLLSPEALVGGGRVGSSCLPPAHELPPVAFACIDEAHCVSEWSHNFRPCYLRLCKVLKERLGVQCLLGLTATATLATAHDVAQHFGIQEEKGIAVRSADVPENLFLTVSTDQDRDQALVTLLRGNRFGALDSIIVYCTRREETTRIAALLRTCLQGVTVKEQPVEQNKEDTPEEIQSKRKKALAKKRIRRPIKWMADSYHAGMSAAERRRVQNQFMSGQLRIVVATVAFGMGLDKFDVRGIIHYNMPKSFENYVQEIGRAGRDGKPAHCHLFLNREGGDLNELRRHIYADTVDYFTVKKLVQNAFPSCKCREIHQKQQDLISSGAVGDDEMMQIPDPSEEQLPEKPEPFSKEPSPRVCQTHSRAMPIQSTIETLDMREEGIETLLCYLELHPQHWVKLMHPTLSTCRLVCYSGPLQLRLTARRCPPVAVAMAKERLSGVDHTHCSSLEFDVVSLADSMGWELTPVKRELRQLQWNTTQFKPGFQGTGKSGILVEFSNLSFHFRSYGDLSFQELDAVCEYLHQRILAREKTALHRLKSSFKAFQSVAFKNCSSCADHINVEWSTCLKQQLKKYFDQCCVPDNSKKDLEQEEEEELEKLKLKEWENVIRADIRQFLSIRHDEKFSGRAIARIFHGIESPCYPAQVFGRDRRFWRKYLNFDFNEIIRLATEEIIRVN